MPPIMPNTRRTKQSTGNTNQTLNEPDSFVLLLLASLLPVGFGGAVVLALVVRALVVTSEVLLGGVLWRSQFDPGNLDNESASMISLCLEAAEIQISAQDLIFAQTPVRGWVCGCVYVYI